MLFVALGVLAVLLKIGGWTAVAGWSWWVVLAPFAAAAAWWTFSDLSGRTQRDAMRRHEARIQRRRKRHLEAIGMTAGASRRSAREAGQPGALRHRRHGRPSAG